MKLFFDGPDGQRTVEVDREMSLGRAPENDIAIRDTQVSRRHAILRPVGGRIEIQDLDSFNGTFVNGERITAPVVVGPGDELLFGETTATVGEDESSAATAVTGPQASIELEPPAAFDVVPPQPPFAPPSTPPEPGAVSQEPAPPVVAARPPDLRPPPRPADLRPPGRAEPPQPAAPQPVSVPPPPGTPPVFAPPGQDAATAVPPAGFGQEPEAATRVDAIGGWSPPPVQQVPRLLVRVGRDEGKELALIEGSELTIGRDPMSGFVLSDGRVSSRHARVYLHGGRLIVEDLGSANGTYVNGARVTTPLAAEEESEIQVGETVLLFTRQPSTYYAGAPAPTLVGARIDSPLDVQAAVEQAVARSESRRRRSMIVFGAVGAVFVIAAAVVIPLVVLGPTGDEQLTEAEVIELVKPATVRIDSYNNDGIPISGGSGSIIDLDQGLVLTNNHVASVGHLEVVNSVNNEAVEAVLFSAAPCDDLALVVAKGLRDSARGLKQVEFGDISSVRQGDRVIALGYPGAAEQFLNRALSATTGVVSKVSTVYDVVGSGVPHLPDVIQTDAAINPGNSGGPLFNHDAKQIGVNTARYLGPAGAQNENYAVSITRVREVLADLRAGRSPKWIGATFAELVDNRSGEPVALGIEEVTPGGPAEAIGLEGFNGDYQFLLVGIDGEEVLTLQDYCALMPEEGVVTLAIYIVAEDRVAEVDIDVGSTGR